MNYDWVQPTLERIADLLKMPDKHNCYGTPKVDPAFAWDAIRFLWDAETALTAPRIIPTQKGGLLFEWSGIKTECRLIFEDVRVMIDCGKIGEPRGTPFGPAIDEVRKALVAIKSEMEPPSVNA